jgi:hypothetical protein
MGHRCHIQWWFCQTPKSDLCSITKCDRFHKMIAVILITPQGAAKCELLFKKLTYEAGLLNNISCLAPALCVGKFTKHKDIAWVTLCYATQVRLTKQP